MKNAKKLLCLLLSILLAASLFGCSNKYQATNSYEEIYSKESISLDVKDDEFKIFKINDTHFINGTCKNDKNTLADLKSALDSCDFDMVIICGDLVDGYSLKITYNKYKAVSIFADLIESYKKPWAFAPGNNDGEKGGSNEDLIAYLMQYENFVCGNTKDIDGSMNFFIDLTKNGKLVHSLAILDSHSKGNDDKYDYIKQSQIDWLNNETNQRKMKTSLFFHMPTPSFKTAYEQGEAYEGYPFSDKYAVDDIKKNELFDNETASNKYISLISVGHVHSDNIAYYYNDRYYQLSSLGGYNAAGAKSTTPSYTLITINLDKQNTRDLYNFSKISGK